MGNMKGTTILILALLFLSLLTVFFLDSFDRFSDSTGKAARTVANPFTTTNPDEGPSPESGDGKSISSGNEFDLEPTKIEINNAELNQPATYTVFVKNTGTKAFNGSITISASLDSQSGRQTLPQNNADASIAPGEEKPVITAQFTPTQAGQTTFNASIVPRPVENNLRNNSITKTFIVTINAGLFVSTEKSFYQNQSSVSLLGNNEALQSRQTPQDNGSQTSESEDPAINGYTDENGLFHEIDPNAFESKITMISQSSNGDEVIVLTETGETYDLIGYSQKYIVKLKQEPVLNQLSQKFGEEKIREIKKIPLTDRNLIRAETVRIKQSISANQSNVESKALGIINNSRQDSQEKIAQAKTVRKISNIENAIVLENILPQEAKKIQALPEVKSIEPAKIYRATMDVAIPLLQTDSVWQVKDQLGLFVQGEGITVGIIDTGVDYTHEDLGNCSTEEFLAKNCEKVVGGWDFVENDADPMDEHFHGTHVAGIVAGNGYPLGVAPKARIFAYRVLNADGTGTTDSIIAAIDASFDPNGDNDFSDRLDVINLSIGRSCYPNYEESCGPDDITSQAIDNAVDHGVVAVVAAGNCGPGGNTAACPKLGDRTISSPGTARKAITIGATFKQDYEGPYWGELNPKENQVTNFSSRGPVEWTDLQGVQQSMLKPDVVAPGAIICAARHDNVFPEGTSTTYKPCINEKHVQLAGTSMASPYVAGIAALARQLYPDMTPQEIKDLIKSTATDLGVNPNLHGEGIITPLALIPISPGITISPKTYYGIVKPDSQWILIPTQNFLFTNNSSEDLTLTSEYQNIPESFHPIRLPQYVVPKNTQKYLSIGGLINTDEFEGGQTMKANFVISWENDRSTVIPLRVFVEEKVSADKKKLDFGNINPSAPSWHAEQKIILKNTRKDTAYQYNATINGFNPNSLFSVNPQQFTIQPGGSQEITITMDDPLNQKIGTGKFNLTISLNGQAEDYEIPVSFTKQFERTIYFTEKPWAIFAINDEFNKRYLTSDISDENKLELLLPNGENFDLLTVWYFNDKYPKNHIVVKENVSSTQDTEITISSSEATHLLEFDLRDQTDKKLNNSEMLNMQRIISSDFAKDNFVISGIGFLQQAKYSDMPENFLFEVALATKKPFTENGVFVSMGNAGINSDADVKLRTNPAEYSLLNINYLPNEAVPISIMKLDNTFNTTTMALTQNEAAQNYSTGTLYFYKQKPSAGTGLAIGYCKLPDCQNSVKLQNLTLLSPLIYRTNDNQTSFIANPMDSAGYKKKFSKYIDPDMQQTIYTGQDIEFFNGLIWGNEINSSGKIYIVGHHEFSLQNTSNGNQYSFPYNIPYIPFRTQMFSSKKSQDFPFSLYKDNSLLVSNNLPGTKILVTSFPYPIASGQTTGTYRLELSKKYNVGGTELNNNVKAVILNNGSSGTDKNPPAIAFFRFYLDGKPTHYLSTDNARQNTFVFEIDPVIGNLAQKQLLFEGNTLELTEVSPNRFQATLPHPKSQVVSMQIFAKDDSENSLEYTFEVPAGLEKSVITNYSNTDLTLPLTVKVKNTNTGEEIATIINKTITVPANSFIDLASEWQNSGGFTPTESGEFEITAQVTDAQGNTFKNNEGKELKATSSFAAG